MLRELIIRNRSYRRFYQEESVPVSKLKEWIDLARLSASAANLQPLKYILSNEPAGNEKIFPLLGWAGYLKEWPGPSEGERPAAYLVVLGDTLITSGFGCDPGIAVQSILLGAVEEGYGGCIIASIDKEGLREALNIPEHLEILLVIALGKPKEEVVIEKVVRNNIKYWRDAKGVHHVPKRSLKEIIVR